MEEIVLLCFVKYKDSQIRLCHFTGQDCMDLSDFMVIDLNNLKEFFARALLS